MLPPPAEHPEELSPSDGYAAWAGTYDEDGNPLVALVGPAVAELIGPVAGTRALDLGCGTGRHAAALAGAGARVVGLDQSPEMLARARQRVAGRPVGLVRFALPGQLPFRDAAFDRVVLGLVAEHVEDLDALMREAARVLKPQGRCVLSGLHPERTAEGQRARFLDADGLRRPIRTLHRTEADYLGSARRAGLDLIEARALVVPPDLPSRYPRAARYVGQRLGWVAAWSRRGAAAVPLSRPGGPG